MSGIKEWFEENEAELIEDFVETHRVEYDDFIANSIEDGAPITRTVDEDGCGCIEHEDERELMREFANEHKGFMRWLECEYGSRGEE